MTLVEKPNVLRETGGLMTRVFRDMAKEYPDIWADEANIDAICMWMFKNPQDYSVLVAENMFGDIVSDLCAGLVGGLGFAPSANLGDKYAVFEPTHGSAPKYAGQYKVNPIAMLLTAKLMLDWLKENDKATQLESAIARVIKEGKVRTYDLGGKATTLDVAKEVAKYASVETVSDRSDADRRNAFQFNASAKLSRYPRPSSSKETTHGQRPRRESQIPLAHARRVGVRAQIRSTSAPRRSRRPSSSGTTRSAAGSAAASRKTRTSCSPTTRKWAARRRALASSPASRPTPSTRRSSTTT